MAAEVAVDRPIPRYETMERLAPDFDLGVLDESKLEELPAGVDLYLVFLEPAAM